MGKIKNCLFILSVLLINYSFLSAEVLEYSFDLDTPVYAVEKGEVTNCGYDMEKGLFIEITAKTKIYTYCHLKTFRVKKGQKIKKNEYIAASGETGITNKPLLKIIIDEINLS